MPSRKKNLILGNVSSGKSTFINSFLKNSILPTSNLVCTSKEIKIKIKNKYKYFRLLEERPEKSRKRKIKVERMSDLENFIQNRQVDSLTLTGPSIEQKLENIIFYDIPGINNSMNEKHKEISMNSLKNNEFNSVFIILNAENLCTTDDALLFNELKREGYGIQKKINIVVNKIDKIYLSDEDTVEEIEKNLINFLNNEKVSNYNLFIYSSIYYELIKKNDLTKRENRELEVLKDFMINKDLNDMRNRIIKEFNRKGE
ncbi:MAG: dynamin family protein [Fusobacteriaceae bacterium]